MIKLGLTGSIGTGKTTIAGILQERGVPVFHADAEGHACLQDPFIRTQILARYPEIEENGEISRRLLGALFFQDLTVAQFVETLVHPFVRAKRELWTEQHAASPVLVYEMPLLFEKSIEHLFDYIVVACVASEIQKERVLERAHMTPERLAQILTYQMPQEEKIARADFVIDTDCHLSTLEDKIMDVITRVSYTKFLFK